jgi:hypothetical protein
MLKYTPLIGIIISLLNTASANTADFLPVCKNNNWPTEEMGLKARISRVSINDFTKEMWLRDYYQFGRPVVITGNATRRWKIWKIENIMEMLYKNWGPESLRFGLNSNNTEFIVDEVDATVTVIAESTRKTAAKKLLQARERAKVRDVDLNSKFSLDFSGDYALLPDLLNSGKRPFQPFLGAPPQFLPIPSDQQMIFASFYVGNTGVSRHQDLSSCLIAWQLQIFGHKRWIIQMPLKSKDLKHWPAESFGEDIEGDYLSQNLVYDFQVAPGELLVWFPQYFHSTEVPDSPNKTASLSLVSHFSPSNITEESLFFKTFWESTYCDDFLHKVFEHCCVNWLKPKYNNSFSCNKETG